MKGDKRAPSQWNLFVKKIFIEGKENNPNFAFKDALKEASRRKGEMGSMGSIASTKKMKKSYSKKSYSKKSKSYRKRTRKNR